MKTNAITKIEKNNEQLMTSIEIATLTNKQHKNVMQAIRKMETAWSQVAGLKFQLGSYEDINGQARPCYFLTKTECLYIATKFNDEARARLIIRWEELEKQRAYEMMHPQSKPQEIRLLACDEEVLDEADEIIGDELAELNRYSKYCYMPYEVAKSLGMNAADMNSFLKDYGIIRRSCGDWVLTSKYRNRGFDDRYYKYEHDKFGRRKKISKLVWTEAGRQFVRDVAYGKIKIKKNEK